MIDVGALVHDGSMFALGAFVGAVGMRVWVAWIRREEKP
jgi:hypothetical protein